LYHPQVRNKTLVRLGAATTSPAAQRMGGKAAKLDALVAADLPVPDTVVIPATAFAADELSAEVWLEIDEAALALGYPLAVRSSADYEDTPGFAAPGVFESVLDVQSSLELRAAVQRVRSSGSTELAQRYLSIVGKRRAQVSVVLQRYIRGCRSGVTYTRRPGSWSTNEMLIETHGHVHRLDRDSGRDVEDGLNEIRVLCLEAEAAIGAHRGADIEWLEEADGTVWLVQARPIVHPGSETSAPSPDDFNFARSDEDTIWLLDSAHNPEPLSLAQQGLVKEVVRGGARLQLVRGHLYYAASEPSPQSLSSSDLRQLFEEVSRRIGAHVEPLEALARPPLEECLSAYAAVYHEYMNVLAPALRAGKRALRTYLATHRPELRAENFVDHGRATLAARIVDSAQGRLTFAELMSIAGPMAPKWDVAEATYSEVPEALQAAVARASESSATPAPRLVPDAGDLATAVSITQCALEIGELDDRLFFRAQALVRRALLCVAEDWQLSDNDIFYVELDEVRHHLGSGVPMDRQALVDRAVLARAEHERNARLKMPAQIQAGKIIETRQPRGNVLFRGVGWGGQVVGTVVRLGESGTSSAGKIVLSQSLTPSLAVQVSGAAAIITADGELLGHGAAMARELGIPVVVQCTGAWTHLANGDEAWLHGERGLVMKTASPAVAEN
jgi:pyruvate,water dikinase